MIDEYGVITAHDTVRLERVLPGPIERIWEYLTNPVKRGQWLAAGEMELRVGGRVEHVFRNSEMTGHHDAPPPKYADSDGHVVHGRVIACDPPRLLAYTWSGPSDESSEVRFELSPYGNEVHLRVIHSRLATRDDLISVAAGWHAHLGILAARLASESPEAFWVTHARLEADYESRIPTG